MESLIPDSLELDLTFGYSPQKILLELRNDSVFFLLNTPEFWTNSLRVWIDSVRKDMSLKCPEIVRRTSCISMGLKFTDDLYISELNSVWRNKKEKTDVLSFPVLDETIVLPESKCVEIGDIFVSVTTAEKQAIERNHGLDVELQWLVSHGLLHLLGWDHPNSASLKEMLSYQEYLLSINCNVQSQSDYPDDH